MNPLAVTAFFDIGRGSWGSLTRSHADYVNYYRHYLARLPVPRYLLANTEIQRAVSDTVELSDEAELSQLPCYRFLERTQQIMKSGKFRSLFNREVDQHHVEHIYPLYNIVGLAKWDALERAATLTGNAFSHYVWIDFGLGGGAQKSYLPKPAGFSPVERDKIVISAEPKRGISRITRNVLTDRVASFADQVATGVMIVPVALLPGFCDLARRNYERLLDMNLTSDDQMVVDMCVAEQPELFHLSFAPRGLTKFNHIHNILNGLDRVQPRTWKIPVYDWLTKGQAHKRIGLGS